MKDILNTYTTTELKKLISQYNKSLGNVVGYSKLKKGQLIQLMTKAENVDKFKNIKAKVPKETVKKAVKKVETKQPPIKKVEPPKPAPKPVKKVEPPKPEPKPVKKVEPPKEDYRISVINKKNKNQSNFDFNFTRDFKYKTIKTDTGYDFVFKNLKDYLTAKDITQFNMDYKNEKLYKWTYHLNTPKPVKKVEPEMDNIRRINDLVIELGSSKVNTILKEKFRRKLSTTNPISIISQLLTTFKTEQKRNELVKALEQGKK